MAAAAAAVLTHSASANPRPLPFTYPYETLNQGELEVEQYADVAPVRIPSDAPEGRWQPIYRFQTEFEYGITDRLELGLYVVYDPAAVGPGLGGDALRLGDEGNGIKQRLRLRLADAGEWPIDVALYGEVSEFEREAELEAKVILAKRIGPLHFMVNLWGEREIPYSDEEGAWVLHPTAGAVYELSPNINFGVEYWMHAEVGNDEDEGANTVDPVEEFNDGTHHYLGPTFMFLWDKLWWSAGVYARLDRTGHTLRPGEIYGNVWARSVIGLSL